MCTSKGKQYEIELRFDREFVADPREYRYSAFLTLVDQLAIEGAS
jgi:hypothetical protein